MTYWQNNGKHQAAYDELFAKLVPDQGKAETAHGEVLRLASNLYYELYNNGGCNIHHDGPKADCVSELAERADVQAFMADETSWDSLFCELSERIQPPEECLSCDGSGEMECCCEDEVDCEECDGFGTLDCDECNGHGHIEPSFYASFDETELENVIDAIILYVIAEENNATAHIV